MIKIKHHPNWLISSNQLINQIDLEKRIEQECSVIGCSEKETELIRLTSQQNNRGKTIVTELCSKCKVNITDIIISNP